MKYFSLGFVILLLIGLNACVYNNEEDLYPIVPDCDSVDVSYAAIIAPLLTQHCTGCHSTASPSAGIALERFEDVKKYAENGSLFGSISHDGNFSPMPKNEARLPDCDVAQVKNWVGNGAQNN